MNSLATGRLTGHTGSNLFIFSEEVSSLNALDFSATGRLTGHRGSNLFIFSEEVSSLLKRKLVA